MLCHLFGERCQVLGYRIRFAGGSAPTLFDLERLISRQKVARVTARVMWSTSAISFHSNPLRCVPNMVRLSRESLRPGFSKLRLVNYERRNFIA